MGEDKKKEEFDSIIIGSGAGGLTTAICLARAGQKVIVLEQHYVPGGWCHSFQLNGQRFSPGVHYIGQLGENGSTRKLYEGLGIANDLVFFRMNDEGFEHCRIGESRFDYPSDPKQFERLLIEQYPEEKKGIQKYLNVVWKTQIQLNKLISVRTNFSKLKVLLFSRTLIRYGMLSLDKVIKKFIKDPELKAILNIQGGDYGVVPSRASFAFHCGVTGHYKNGGFYPMGGGASIVKSMTNAIKQHGGEVRTRTSVNQILVKNGEAYGVELGDGTILKAKNVISNADPHVTYTKLLDQNVLSKKLRNKLNKVTYSPASLILFVTVDMDVKEKGIDSGNYWVTKDHDLEGQFNYSTLDEVVSGEKFPSLFISCSTMKDPSAFNGTYHNFEMVTFVDNTIFEEFEGTVGSVEEAYRLARERIAEKFLNNLEELVPGSRDCIVQMELGTPKTNKFYINTTRGSVYGIEKTLDQLGKGAFQATSEIKNLYLCGASTLSHGVAGATNSGVLTAAQILGCEMQDLLKENPDQKLRVYDAEGEETWPIWLTEKMEVRQRRFKKINAEDFLEHVDPNNEQKIAG